MAYSNTFHPLSQIPDYLLLCHYESTTTVSLNNINNHLVSWENNYIEITETAIKINN